LDDDWWDDFLISGQFNILPTGGPRGPGYSFSQIILYYDGISSLAGAKHRLDDLAHFLKYGPLTLWF
jgi:hypothetical protein